jgi:hypothetical protein
MVRQALLEERQRLYKLNKIAKDEWLLKTPLERNISPGPGEYVVRSDFGGTGGSWGRNVTKTHLDWEMLRAKQLPGPGEYNVTREGHVKVCARACVLSLSTTHANVRVTLLGGGAQGGSWGRSSGKSDVEWTMYRASQMPGPTDYDVRPRSAGFGAKIGDTTPLSDIDIKIKKAPREPVRARMRARAPTAVLLRRCEMNAYVCARAPRARLTMRVQSCHRHGRN